MLIQLNPPIPLETPKGKGQAHCLIDYSIEQDLMWVVFLDSNGECWTFRNSDIRAQRNLTIGRGKFTAPGLPIAVPPPVEIQSHS